MANFGSYTGREFLGLEFQERPWLIKGMMRERDAVLFLGGEKAGKSIVIKQIACALTSGTPFLDEYEVDKARKVTYIQVEGDLADTQTRMKRMTLAVDFDPDNFQIIFSEPLALQRQEDTIALIRKIEACHKPDVVIFDPLYFCFEGSLSEDMTVRAFLGNVRRLKQHLDCAVIIVHHTHRAKMDGDGNLINEGDQAMHGSGALRWWPDHIVMLSYDKKSGKRVFSCDTQRSGDIEKNLLLELIQPSPLYFRKIGLAYHDHSIRILDHIRASKSPITVEEVCQSLDIARTTFYRDSKRLLLENKIQKTHGKRPALYQSVSVCVPNPILN